MLLEVFDARRFPHNWHEVSFDDSSWGTAQVVPALYLGGLAHSQPPTNPYDPLYPRSIALLGGGVKKPVYPRCTATSRWRSTTTERFSIHQYP